VGLLSGRGQGRIHSKYSCPNGGAPRMVKMKKGEKGKLPEFESLEEMGEFWDTHDFTDFESEFTEVKDVEINIRNRIYLPLSVAMYEKMEKIADSQGKTVEALIREWLSEKLTAF
jgi:hypothetical protein